MENIIFFYVMNKKSYIKKYSTKKWYEIHEEI